MLQQLAYKLQADEKGRIQTKLDGLSSECEHFLRYYVTYFENDKSREAAYQRVQSLRFNVKEFCREVLQRLNKEIDVFIQKDGEIIVYRDGSGHFEIEDGYSDQLEFYFKTYFHCVCVLVVAAILEWYFYDSHHPDYYEMLKKEVSSELEKYNNVIGAIKRKIDEEKNSIDSIVNLIRDLKFWDNDSWLRWQNVNDNGEIQHLIGAFQKRVKEDNNHFPNMYKNISKLIELDIKKLPFFLQRTRYFSGSFMLFDE